MLKIKKYDKITLLMKVKLIGQSCFQIKTEEEVIIITDPWFGLPYLRAVPLAVKPEQIDRCDLMLASHAHIDHLDNIALMLAKSLGATFIGSLGAEKKAKKKGLKKVYGLTRGESLDFKGLKIQAVLAEHPFAPDAIGFVVEGKEKFYFSGDTRYNELLVKELNQYKPDICFLQIACAVYFFKKDGMDIKDAVKLVKDVKPKIALPMHYQVRGKVANPKVFAQSLKDTPTRVIILNPGEEKEITST